MELKKAAELRNSIRDFDASKKVEKSTVEEILRFAQKAPSWKNSQTGRYYAVCDPEKVAAVKAECLPGFNQNSSSGAPVLIVAAFEKNVSGHSNGEADNECGNEWGAYDLGLQNAYLCLAATEAGLDTLIMGIRDSAKLREMLSIPASQEIMAVIALGSRKADVAEKSRKELSEIACFC